MIRAITALTLAVGMCLSSAAFAAPVAPKAKASHTLMHRSRLMPMKTLKKTSTMKRQPRLPANAHDKMYRGKIKRTFPRPLLRTRNLQRVK